MAELELVNAALVVLGEPEIASADIPAPSKGQRALISSADGVRRELLQKQRWTAALKYATLDPDAGDSPLGFSYQSPPVPDFLALWDAGADAYTQIAGKRIAWRGPARLQICYAADARYVDLDPLLAAACAKRLAARCAKNITEKAADLKFYNDLAYAAEVDAAARDAVSRRETPLLGGSRWDYPGQDDRRPGWAP